MLLQQNQHLHQPLDLVDVGDLLVDGEVLAGLLCHLLHGGGVSVPDNLLVLPSQLLLLLSNLTQR